MTETGTRAERKERTRQALIDGTLDLLRDRSLASVSLREVTRSAGIVPTAFYRHFASMEDLGVALVEDSMRMLRQMLRDARKDPSVKNATESLRILVRQVRSHEDQFRFLARERYGGVAEVRAQRHEGHFRCVTHALGFAVPHPPAQSESDTGVDTWPRPHSVLRGECAGKNLRHHLGGGCARGGRGRGGCAGLHVL
nr:TetR family transcriptional regulator [uncultured Rhodococcus sp.]